MRYGYIFITQYVPTVDRLAYGSYDIIVGQCALCIIHLSIIVPYGTVSFNRWRKKRTTT